MNKRKRVCASIRENTMEEKYKHILNESARIFQTYGIRNISMDDISRELGISKKTLYQYVSNKADLLLKTLEYLHEQDNEALFGVKAAEGNAIDQLLAVSKNVCLKTKGYSPVHLFELRKYYREVYQSFFTMKNSAVAGKIRENLEHGIKEGLYREDLDIELVSRLYLKNLEDLHQVGGIETGEVSLEKVFQTMFDNHIRGIVNARGLEYYERKING